MKERMRREIRTSVISGHWCWVNECSLFTSLPSSKRICFIIGESQ